MHRSRLGNIIIDCNVSDLDEASEFWSQALGLEPEDPDQVKNDRYRILQGPADQPKVLVQHVDHESRIHIDIETDDIDAEVKRLEKLGAVRETQSNGWWVLRTPSGQKICVVSPQREDFSNNATRWQ